MIQNKLIKLSVSMRKLMISKVESRHVQSILIDKLIITILLIDLMNFKHNVN